MKRLSVLVPILVLTLGCDPGIAYSPQGWRAIRNYEFANSYKGFDLEMRGIYGLIGSTNYIMDGEILNTQNTPRHFSVERAVLDANGSEFVGEPIKQPNSVRDTKPGESQHINIYWDFKKSMSEVLKDPVELILVINDGHVPVSISIPLTKQK